MLIKHQSLQFEFNKAFPAVFVITGSEILMMNQVAEVIKKTWFATHNSDIKKLDDSSLDWAVIQDEVNGYSLFSDASLIDIRYEKKTLEKEALHFFKTYLPAPNPATLIIMRAPHLAPKSLQTLSNDAQVIAIQTKYPSKQAVLQWITTELRANEIKAPIEASALIEQYTRGNLLAASQVMQKLALNSHKHELSIDAIKAELVDERAYQLYELADACLSGQGSEAILILRRALSEKTEATYLLWFLSQEVRNLLQLYDLSQKGSFQSAISALNIWPQRAGTYQTALKRHSKAHLMHLLTSCHQIDSLIKSSQSPQIQRALELLIVGLATGRQAVYVE